jgi:hypothetical protein
MYSFTKQTNTPIPHGQVNFSRIRDVFIQLNTDAYPSTKQLRVVGVNYNVLSIKDGIAGLMFNSNDNLTVNKFFELTRNGRKSQLGLFWTRRYLLDFRSTSYIFLLKNIKARLSILHGSSDFNFQEIIKLFLGPEKSRHSSSR